MAEVMRMPLLSDTMTEGTVVDWHKEIGDTIEIGELLLEIETDKAVMEQDSFFEGVLLHIGVTKGDTVPVDALLCVIGEEGEDPLAAIAADEAGDDDDDDDATEEAVIETVAPAESIAPSSSDERVKASPLAKKMAEDSGINLSTLKGSGEHGRIVKRDIEAYLDKQATSAPAPKAPTAPKPIVTKTATPPPPPAFGSGEASYEDVAVSGMRKTIARRLGESKYTAPHFYLTVRINMENAKTLRKKLNAFSPVKISFNDLVVKSAAMALRQHPAVNSSWLGDHIRLNKVYNIGVAVAIDEGLLVPVVKHADMKSLSQISTEVRAYAGKARERKITPAEMSGNTFTISNLGMMGIEEFTAIINSPDACIMAVGAIVPTPIVDGEEIKVAGMMKVTLSCDHRVVDGAKGAAFLKTFKEILEDPIRLLV